MLDIERIIQTRIPDIAPVYGGVRGRTMSARHQAYAWPIIREAGVKTYIDLREADKSNRLPNLCQLNGLEYFHYPIDNHVRTIAQMVELFPQFCEQIDKGDFYIACAMGLHRTDIALCTYWLQTGRRSQHRQNHACAQCLLSVYDRTRRQRTDANRGI